MRNLAEYTVTATPQPRDKCHPDEPGANAHNGNTTNWKLTLAYDGSDFAGWQVQPGTRTVQGALASALERIVGESVLPQGSGRTDAGVHALGQVASFALKAPIPAENLLRALRLTLPNDIEPLSLSKTSPDFHARHSALAKTYEYRVYCGNSCSPFLARYVHATGYTLDLTAMQHAARAIEGEYDFASFAATDPDRAIREQRLSDNYEGEGNVATLAAVRRTTTVRRISCSAWTAREDGILVYRVTGSGFLHHMVRNLAGTLLEVGRRALEPDALLGILEARSRSAAGPTAPARGLFLVNIRFPGEKR